MPKRPAFVLLLAAVLLPDTHTVAMAAAGSSLAPRGDAPASIEAAPWTTHGPLGISPGHRHLSHADGTPFLWLGCTPWGMTEWLTREEVDTYLDDRAAKGMNVVQLCLFWGKRTDHPVHFELNPPNAYGHRAFTVDPAAGLPDPARPAVVAGGSPIEPNDYWDHVDYCLQAAARRGMMVAALPVWGRRYVNASHKGHSAPVFDETNARAYGVFLATRFANTPNLIWVLGGDVAGDRANGDHTATYRALAAGLATAGSHLVTYHPDGNPAINSSTLYHQEAWLDFNMIETFIHRDHIATAVRADLALTPARPTILAEPAYEGINDNHYVVGAAEMRQQAWHAFFAGAAGFTYGGAFDADGRGPLFGPSNDWQPLLALEGAAQLRFLRAFLLAHDWPRWSAAPASLRPDPGSGEHEVLAVSTPRETLVYFPPRTTATVDPAGLSANAHARWFVPRTGGYRPADLSTVVRITPPADLEDAVLIVPLDPPAPAGPP